MYVVNMLIHPCMRILTHASSITYAYEVEINKNLQVNKSNEECKRQRTNKYHELVYEMHF